MKALKVLSLPAAAEQAAAGQPPAQSGQSPANDRDRKRTATVPRDENDEEHRPVDETNAADRATAEEVATNAASAAEQEVAEALVI